MEGRIVLYIIIAGYALWVIKIYVLIPTSESPSSNEILSNLIHLGEQG